MAARKKVVETKRSRDPEVTLGAKGRVVIPASVRRELGLNKGDSFSVSVEGSRLVLASRKARLEALEEELGRVVKRTPGRSYSEELDRERDEEAAAEDRS